MEGAHPEEPPGLGLHMPVNHIAGAIGAWVVKGEHKVIGLGTELRGSLPRRSR
jgi:hypothetical protein